MTLKAPLASPGLAVLPSLTFSTAKGTSRTGSLEASSPPASYHCAASPSSSQETALRCCGAWFLHEAPPPSRGYSEDSWVHPNGQDRCEGNSSHLTQGQGLDTRYQTRKLCIKAKGDCSSSSVVMTHKGLILLKKIAMSQTQPIN